MYDPRIVMGDKPGAIHFSFKYFTNFSTRMNKPAICHLVYLHITDLTMWDTPTNPLVSEKKKLTRKVIK